MRQKLLFLCVFAFSATALGQSNYAVLSGSVTDPQSQAVAGATVELTSTSTGAVRRASTNEQGIYEIPGLQPGDYELQLTATGFAARKQSVRLEVAQKLAMDLRLSVESHKETVDVSGNAEVIHTNEAALGEVVEPTSIENLPLNGRMPDSARQ